MKFEPGSKLVNHIYTHVMSNENKFQFEKNHSTNNVLFVEASTTRGHGEFLRDTDAATVACQKSGIYPTFDSAAGLG